MLALEAANRCSRLGTENAVDGAPVGAVNPQGDLESGHVRPRPSGGRQRKRS
jgi:hypothetical protein